MSAAPRIVIVSNRLPVTMQVAENKFRLLPSNGGLVSALLPVLRARSGCWVGWTGAEEHDAAMGVLKDYASTQKYSFAPVFLSSSERDLFYRGFSNEIIWPLFHGLPSRCLFDSAYWRAYCKTNGKFADAAAKRHRCSRDRHYSTRID